LDDAGITNLLARSENCLILPLALSILELALIDAGAATCMLSGSLAQMPIRDFGTPVQRNGYLNAPGTLHGALCLTEPLPGAGAEAASLTGRMSFAGAAVDGQPQLEIHKRGRFTSHMDFAGFVLAAVEGDGQGVRGSGLVILEPNDTGEFDRGAPVRKLGHRFASTTNPVFRLRVPAARLVGGFTLEQGAVVPRHSHRILLEPTLRRMRVLLAVMTAAKALETVHERTRFGLGGEDLDQHLALANLWAAGEAAASLGFSAARSNDAVDLSTETAHAASRLAALLSPAAKLFSSSALPPLLQRVATFTAPGDQIHSNIQARLVDAQIEDMYMGPAALQRRLVSATMTGAWFLTQFSTWIKEVRVRAPHLPKAGAGTLAASMELWLWTLGRLRQTCDARGAKLFCDARQGVTFSMADALCGLLAAHSMAMDLDQWQVRPQGAERAIFADLGFLAAGQVAGRVAQICTDALCGSAERFSVSIADQRDFMLRRAGVDRSLRGVADARERIAEFLRVQSGCTAG
jgi:hypothetical protein